MLSWVVAGRELAAATTCAARTHNIPQLISHRLRVYIESRPGFNPGLQSNIGVDLARLTAVSYQLYRARAALLGPYLLLLITKPITAW